MWRADGQQTMGKRLSKISTPSSTPVAFVCQFHPDYKALRPPKSCELCWDIYKLKSHGRRGNCYVAVEALYHLMGGKASAWVPMRVRHEGDVHWFLGWKVYAAEHPMDRQRRYTEPIAAVVIDPTAKQFKTPVPYHLGRPAGFLTKEPSKRARALMEKMLWQ